MGDYSAMCDNNCSGNVIVECEHDYLYFESCEYEDEMMTFVWLDCWWECVKCGHRLPHIDDAKEAHHEEAV